MASDTFVDFVAGWCSGATAVLLCQPVDTVLTRWQATAVAVNDRPMTMARGLVSDAGVKSLWRGSSAMIGVVPFQNALLMSGYGLGKRFCNEDDVLWGSFFGGCVGGVVQSFLVSPVELIKVRQQVFGVGALKATTAVTKGLFSSSSWRGLNATILRDGLPHGVWFASYEYAKTYLDELIGGTATHHDTMTIPLLSGAFAATTAWGVGYPFDLIKTKIQAGSSDKGILATAMELRAEPGGLYRGFGLKLVRAVPASMIGFTVYEFVKNEMIKRN